MKLQFEKWSGAGNDFILVDLRSADVAQNLLSFKKTRAELAIAFCRRTQSLGADGLIFLMSSQDATTDLAWDFYNADGSSAEMCGNAARCVGGYELRKTHRREITILTESGVVSAQQSSDKKISVFLNTPVLKEARHSVSLSKSEPALEGAWIDSGVPHFVIELPELRQLPARTFSEQLRFHSSFGLAGANVTYVIRQQNVVHAVTYERGVEDYTQACGTGAVAAAFFLNLQERTPGKARDLQMPGGLLEISWPSEQAVLTGDARQICIGHLTQEAM